MEPRVSALLCSAGDAYPVRFTTATPTKFFRSFEAFVPETGSSRLEQAGR